MKTIFQVFTEKSSYVEMLSRKVNKYIAEHEDKGFKVVDRQVDVATKPSNALIDAEIVVSVWMEKES